MTSYEISKSSLLSLKAEILRKEEDLAKAKEENVKKIKTIKKKSLELKNKGVELRQLKDVDFEEQDLLKLSKSKLAAKSILYDKLSRDAQGGHENNHYLVRFDQKQNVSSNSESGIHEVSSKAIECPADSEEEEKYDSDDYDDNVEPSEKWVEYRDCLGRSRKCLQKDLKQLMSNDADLKATVEERQQNQLSTLGQVHQDVTAQNQSTTNQEERQSEFDADKDADEPEMISGDMRQDILRKKWEKEEEEIRHKTSIHYQNVLFDEARQHGVGYYAFSKDEDERAKQQEALKHLRQETQQQQKKAQDLKLLREKQLAARMKAARNRRRARLGLPPEEDEPQAAPDPLPSETEKQNTEMKEKEESEALLAEARKRHVRPWDVGKEGVTEHHQMTQQEWNVKKRQERPAEFAPPAAYNSRGFSSVRNVNLSFDDSEKSLRFSSSQKLDKCRKRKLQNINPYKTTIQVNDSAAVFDDHLSNDHLMEDYRSMQSDSVSDNSSSYNPDDPTSDPEDDILLNDYIKSINKNAKKPIPIVNEIESADFDDNLLEDYKSKRVIQNASESEIRSNSKGAEIAPPPTFEYHGPITKKVTNPSRHIDIEESIEAGLKFLRNQAERTRRHYDFSIV